MNTIVPSCDTNNIQTEPVTIFLDGNAFARTNSTPGGTNITLHEYTASLDLRDWTELRITASMTGFGHLGHIEILYSLTGAVGPSYTYASPSLLGPLNGSDISCDIVWKPPIPEFIRFYNNYTGGSGVQGDLSEAKQIKMYIIGRKKIKNNSFNITAMPTFNMNSGNGALAPTDRIYSL